MTILKRNELVWYPMPERILRERADLETLKAALHNKPQFTGKGESEDETDERQGDF